LAISSQYKACRFARICVLFGDKKGSRISGSLCYLLIGFA
jgi:hypothetical protein